MCVCICVYRRLLQAGESSSTAPSTAAQEDTRKCNQWTHTGKLIVVFLDISPWPFPVTKFCCPASLSTHVDLHTVTCVSRHDSNVIRKINLALILINNEEQYHHKTRARECCQNSTCTFNVKLPPSISLWSSDSPDLIYSCCSSPPSRRVSDLLWAGLTRPQNTPLPVTRSAAVTMKRGTGEIVIICIIIALYTMHFTQSLLLIQKTEKQNGGDKKISHSFSVSKQQSYETWPDATYQLWNHY